MHLYIFIEMGWGLLISAIARTQGQALMAVFISQFPEIILSGQAVLVENMPRVAQVVSNLVPNKYYNDIVEGIMLRGSTLADLWPQVVALGVLGIIPMPSPPTACGRDWIEGTFFEP